MKPSPIKQLITCVLLVLFLAMKLTGIHTMSHTDDVDEVAACSICDYAISQSAIPTIAANFNDFPVKKKFLFITPEVINNYTYSDTSAVISMALFSRPPPTLL
ncbi:hypothetical protein [Maribacter ulvicola]|uniref:Uncharacterized protein n=1 Tax=Maribacter ulvicola TaxID=228959 RepID=A0A1N6UED2_9FLAO|nr:hypothetical protein [Maribacter ulvicola]SIQ64018.1 hypothetical protein SAMN05421797_102314 [Maribacter ulvicola]